MARRTVIRDHIARPEEDADVLARIADALERVAAALERSAELHAEQNVFQKGVMTKTEGFMGAALESSLASTQAMGLPETIAGCSCEWKHAPGRRPLRVPSARCVIHKILDRASHDCDDARDGVVPRDER